MYSRACVGFGPQSQLQRRHPRSNATGERASMDQVWARPRDLPRAALSAAPRARVSGSGAVWALFCPLVGARASCAAAVVRGGALARRGALAARARVGFRVFAGVRVVACVCLARNRCIYINIYIYIYIHREIYIYIYM